MREHEVEFLREAANIMEHSCLRLSIACVERLLMGIASGVWRAYWCFVYRIACMSMGESYAQAQATDE